MNHSIDSIHIEKHPQKGFRLLAKMFIALPRAEVFEFFADARQLERLTPPWLNFRILTPMPIELTTGSLIDYRIRLRYIPIKWRTEISVWQPPFRFVDQQLRGPYKKWYHEHRFEEVDGGTLVIDDVHYISPGGRLVNQLIVQPDLERIFKYRHQELRKIFSTSQRGQEAGV